MKYIVITESTPSKLSKTITDMLSNGWALQGGVSVSILQYQSIYAQAMIKED